MKLYLVRHGDYVTSGPQQQDVLSERGINQIQQLANFLLPLSIRVARSFHSGKNRAQQTAELLAPSIHCEQPMEARNGLNPNDDVVAFANEITSWEEDRFIVGHLPFMSRLVSYLVIGNENKEIVTFQTGTLVCLEAIDTKRWVIQWIIQPNLLMHD